ncbi:MAG: DNA-directed RNA polymerase subunit beta [Candidatus Tagabacteria bacterium CG03_land_8_20_14_0_80_41_22]|uniref:DNA-directed RNA polymerase subunit beta n=1 Tax=Candidatus Tagabacteria bacterium CG03_land_8_20_14_0_80_41_22 TaxID=1975020 RepID=A0A2M7B8R3_9BACT|nr:MAG: DNA-directed RNA polymerase subunit beta [Candidatus Tagabacteria bacterium CG03_land_8_20_14_0_80_41_22]
MHKKYFAKYKEPFIPLPNLVEMQLNSFNWFLKEGLKELFHEFSPINDYAGKEFFLEFLDYSIDEPKYDEYYAKANNLSYEVPLKIRVRLTKKETQETKEQDVFLTDMPLMTEHGTFIVNGVERVVVAQLARSFGVYFTINVLRGRNLFGAKIIPNRGAWIEVETDFDGVMYVRIDRKRKIPVTTFLRVFGLKDSKEIEKNFSKVDNGEINYIKKTLEKDDAATVEEAYVEIYKRIRPGELATVENAKELLDDMFSPSRYDFSSVGRYKFNQRLGLPLKDIKSASRTLSLEDLIAVVSEVINMNNNPEAQPDDIDHLGNRRIRAVGEMLQNQLRIGMARMKRNIQDRMSTLDPDVLTPFNLINSRLFSAVLKKFFTTSQLSQFMSQKNTLDELEHLRRLSALGPGGLTKERAGFEVRDVHISHYGRICPIETPEGPTIGLVVHLASYSRLNEYGILETPYRRVKNGVIASEIVYLDASEESKYNIAHSGIEYDKDGKILENEIEARVHGQPGIVLKDKIDFIDVAPQQAFSIATSLIPFLEHDDANRALMGSNMQRQAVPCLQSEAPLVATGIEERAARDSGRLFIADDNGKISHVDATSITLKTKTGKEKNYKLVSFLRSNDFTIIHQRPVVDSGEEVVKGQILADTSASDHGQLALGQNIVVAFLSWNGANFEDAIILSRRLVEKDKFTSVHIEKFSVQVRDTKLGPEITTYDIPNVGEEKLKDLDEEGIIRVGAEVRSGDILVGKISPKGEAELTPEERLLRSFFGEKARDVKDTSLRMEHGKQGRIVGIKIFSRDHGDKLDVGVIKEIHIEVAQIRKVSVGDKLAGRHGNKGVISKILPIEDMPYLEDGTPVDIILNPLGVASRMNIGQILETHLGLAASRLGYQAICPSLNGATDEEIIEEMQKAGWPVDGKVTLYDGRTGEPFQQKVTVGSIYMMKLAHMVEDKIHMRSVGPYSLITQQPLGGKAQGGGQRFGEMEVWALEGYGAAHTLQEMLTIKSDDMLGRTSAYEAIVRGERFKNPHLPASFYVLLHELKGLALDVELEGI